MSHYRMHRGWMDNPVLATDDPFSKREAWEWMISSARFKDGEEWVNGGPVVVLRGQICKAFRYMAKAWKWDESRVRRFCKSLEKATMIQCGTAAGQSIITICNYEIYQADGCGDDATSDASSPQHRRSTAANIKKGNKGNTSDSPQPPEHDEIAEQFEGWWRQYPSGRKQAKTKCLEAYRRIVKSGKATPSDLLAGAMRYAAAGYDNSKYVKGPLVWLNGSHWEDEDIPPPGDKPIGGGQRPPPGRGSIVTQAFDDLDASLFDRSGQ